MTVAPAIAHLASAGELVAARTAISSAGSASSMSPSFSASRPRFRRASASCGAAAMICR